MLAISIPNLRGMNAAIMRRLNPSLLTLHHCEIMALERFRTLFEGIGMVPLCCGYVGVFPLGLQAAEPGSLERFKVYQRLAWDRVPRWKRPMQALARWRCRNDAYGFPLEKFVVDRLRVTPVMS